jgi:hypothetical protein
VKIEQRGFIAVSGEGRRARKREQLIPKNRYELNPIIYSSSGSFINVYLKLAKFYKTSTLFLRFPQVFAIITRKEFTAIWLLT